MHFRLHWAVYAVMFAGTVSAFEDHHTAETVLAVSFPQADSISYEKFVVPDSAYTRAHDSSSWDLDNRTMTIVTVRAGPMVVGHAILDSVQSKSSLLSYCLILDTSGSIISLHMLHTPDSRSAKLQSAFWRRQFAGRHHIGNGAIDAMSGATISSQDVTDAVRFLMALFRPHRIFFIF